MLSKKLEEAIIKQIKAEEESSRLYLSMASWCEVNGYAGAAAFLFDHATEERMHALKFLNYVNDRGGHARVLALEEPEATFESLHKVFEKVLEHEVLVTGLINNLVALSMEEKDFTTHNFLQWFVTEQIEEESLARGILDKFKLAEGDKGGLFHIDKELAGIAAAEAAGNGAA
ncbi:MAG TPA: ferritin [Bacteroidales bacterium]|nr:ferritin [Bacteroidales bacterium]